MDDGMNPQERELVEMAKRKVLSEMTEKDLKDELARREEERQKVAAAKRKQQWEQLVDHAPVLDEFRAAGMLRLEVPRGSYFVDGSDLMEELLAHRSVYDCFEVELLLTVREVG